jgi:Fur family zinc uptake transcriptional regulator
MSDPHIRLLNAKAWCEKKHVRLTPQRQQVLQLILQHPTAITAYELLGQLQASTQPNAKPPTVYRALDFLLTQGLIHKVQSTNRYLACCLPDHPHHSSQLFICDDCGQITEIHDNEIANALTQKAQLQGFTMTNPMIEIHGICQNCTKILK